MAPRISKMPAGGRGRPGGPLFDVLVRAVPPEQEEIARGAQEAERERIAQALHDGLCQELLGLACELKALATAAAEQGCPSGPKLQRAAELVSAAMEATRAVVHDLLPPELEEGGLIRALERLAPGAVTVQSGDLQLSPGIAAEVYRIAQEAVRNARRHSGAREIRIALEHDAASYTLCVEDEGCGLAAGAGNHDGCGLRIMRRRAAAVGAELRVEARPGGGTRVICTGPKTAL